METFQKHLYTLILAGGGGTRLWPQSRDADPKQFIKLFGKKSLFELALERAKQLTSPSRIIVVTNSIYKQQVRKLANSLPAENILIEPQRKDTAMATGLGVTYANFLDPKSVVVNLAADHLISPLSTFKEQVYKAAKIAFETQKFVTIGVKPKYANPGYGHIKFKIKSKGNDILVGDKFVEKPDITLAEKYTQSGQYLWNSNLFVFSSKLMLGLLQQHAPKTYNLLPKIAGDFGTDRENQTIQLAYQMAPKISIDYAVVEKLTNFVCMEAKFNWTDVGDWQEVWKNLPKDELGNVIEGPLGKGQYIGIDSKDNLFFLGKKLVTTVGLSNMIVVDTPDALLICPKNDAQGVKKIVELLKEQKLTDYL